MVYRTYLVDKRTEFQPPEPEIISLSDYVEGERSVSIDEDDVKLCFEFTVNFDDLFPYSDQINGKSVAEALANIQSAMDSFQKKGYVIGVPDEDNPKWRWGPARSRMNGIVPEIANDKKRIEILLYWLDGVRELLNRNKDVYDENYVFVID